jgi:RNA polymerase sigma factor (sigma-70 family)
MLAAEEDALIRLHWPLARLLAGKHGRGRLRSDDGERLSDALLGLLRAVRTHRPHWLHLHAWIERKVRGALLDGDRERSVMSRSLTKEVVAGRREALHPATRQELPDGIFSLPDCREEAPDASLVRRDLLGRLLRDLSVSERSTVERYYLDGLTHAQIAAADSLSRTGVLRRLTDLMQQLREKAALLAEREKR